MCPQRGRCKLALREKADRQEKAGSVRNNSPAADRRVGSRGAGGSGRAVAGAAGGEREPARANDLRSYRNCIIKKAISIFMLTAFV